MRTEKYVDQFSTLKQTECEDNKRAAGKAIAPVEHISVNSIFFFSFVFLFWVSNERNL